MLKGMDAKREASWSVDLTGLSEDARRAVEALVVALREQGSGQSTFHSPEEWCRALRAWAASHRRTDHAADWGRDAIYAGRGE
jgi:hypothetical protein